MCFGLICFSGLTFVLRGDVVHQTSPVLSFKRAQVAKVFVLARMHSQVGLEISFVPGLVLAEVALEGPLPGMGPEVYFEFAFANGLVRTLWAEVEVTPSLLQLLGSMLRTGGRV